MKSKFITFYSVLVSIIFVGAVTLFGVNLFNEYKSGYSRTRRRFDSTTISVKKIFSETNEFSPSFYNQLENAIGSLDDYMYLEIRKNGAQIYSYPVNGVCPEENTRLVKIYMNPVKVGDDNIFLRAALYTLRPATIASSAKISFVIVLIFTAITIMLILYLTLNENKSNVEISEEENTEEKSIDEIDLPEESSEDDSNNEDVSGDEHKFIDKKDDTDSSEKETVELKDENENNDENTNEETEVTVTETEVPAKEAKLPEDDGKPSEFSENPQGLFSPATGFGWEAYLMPRLESELVRASSSETDLALFIIKLENVPEKSIQMKNVSNLLLDTFQYKDMIFEHGENCFAAIKTDVTIDDAIPMADNLHSNISNAIADCDGECFIGLSSRTLRIINGERILKEAEVALQHAVEEKETPIIAFRANAEKYGKIIQ